MKEIRKILPVLVAITLLIATVKINNFNASLSNVEEDVGIEVLKADFNYENGHQKVFLNDLVQLEDPQEVDKINFSESYGHQYKPKNQSFKDLFEDSRYNDILQSFDLEPNGVTGSLPPPNGTWIINTTTVVKDMTLILNGSVYVNKTGALILDNATLIFNSVYPYFLIDSGGNLTAHNSEIKPMYPFIYYYRIYLIAYNGSKIYINSTRMIGIGHIYPAQIFASNVVIVNSIMANSTGMRFYSNNSLLINNVFENLFYYGLEFRNSVNVTLYDNEFRGDSFIRILNSERINITHNTFDVDFVAMSISDSQVYIINNVIKSRRSGVSIGENCVITLYDNVFFNGGILLKSSLELTERNNTINGLPILFLFDETNRVVRNVGQIFLIRTNNITVEETFFNSSIMGVSIIDSENVRVRMNDFFNVYIGVYIGNSKNVELSRNNFLYTYESVEALHSTNFTIYLNLFEGNTYGIVGANASGLAYLNNFIDNNYDVIKITYYYYLDFNLTLDNGVFGNYWSQYSGNDVDYDLWGDSPHIASSNLIDNHPILGLIKENSDGVIYAIAKWRLQNNSTYVKAMILVGEIRGKINFWFRVNNATFTIASNFDSQTSTYYAIIDFENVTEASIIVNRNEQSPVIHEVFWTPNAPKVGEDLTIYAYVTDDFGVYKVLITLFNETWSTLEMNYDSTVGLYWITLNKVSNSSLIFKISAVDEDSNWVHSSFYTIEFIESKIVKITDAYPEILSISWNPINPTTNGNVTIYASISDDRGISNVILSYFYQETWRNITMIYEPILNLYKATLNIPENTTAIFIKVIVIDTSGQTTISPTMMISISSTTESIQDKNETTKPETGSTGRYENSMTIIITAIASATITLIISAILFRRKEK